MLYPFVHAQVKQRIDSLKRSRSRLNAYRALASPAYMALACPDPITTTFELRQEMKQVAQVEKEFQVSCRRSHRARQSPMFYNWSMIYALELKLWALISPLFLNELLWKLHQLTTLVRPIILPNIIDFPLAVSLRWIGHLYQLKCSCRVFENSIAPKRLGRYQ